MELLNGRHCQYSLRESSQKAPRSQQRPTDPAPPHCSKTFAHVFELPSGPLSSAELLLFAVVLLELLLLVVFELMSVVLVEVPTALVGLVGLPVVLVGMLSLELMGGSVVVALLVVGLLVGGVMLLLH